MTVRRIAIFDSTLHEGGEARGPVLPPDAKAQRAVELERLGVDVIEAGCPAASQESADGVRAVAAAVRGATVCALARASAEDVEAAWASLGDSSGRRRVHVLVATDQGALSEEASAAVALAAGLAEEVQVSFEGATGAEPELVAALARAALRAGATVVGLPDTAGRCLPDEYAAFLRRVRFFCPPLDRATLSVRASDHLGLAVANVLAGVSAGAGQVECTLGGVGSAAGTAALEEVVRALTVRRDRLRAATGVEPGDLAAAALAPAAVGRRDGIPLAATRKHVTLNGMLEEVKAS